MDPHSLRCLRWATTYATKAARCLGYTSTAVTTRGHPTTYHSSDRCRAHPPVRTCVPGSPAMASWPPTLRASYSRSTHPNPNPDLNPNPSPNHNPIPTPNPNSNSNPNPNPNQASYSRSTLRPRLCLRTRTPSDRNGGSTNTMCAAWRAAQWRRGSRSDCRARIPHGTSHHGIVRFRVRFTAR